MKKPVISIVIIFALSIILTLPAMQAFAFSNDQSAMGVIGQTLFTTNFSSNPPTLSSLNAPSAITFDKSGNLWVADAQNNRVLEFTAPISNGKGATLVIGQSNFVSNSCVLGTSLNTMCGPTSLAFDKSGNLWVADISNGRVLEFTAPFSIDETASFAIGHTGAASPTTLESPDGIAFDNSGNLWVADGDHNRILEFTTPLSSGEAASLVIGQTDFISSIFGTTQTSFKISASLAFDKSGNLWVSDVDNARILEFTAPFSTGEGATTVIGQTDFTTGTYGTTQTTFGGYAGIIFDSNDNLWAADELNSRVLEFSSPLSTGEAASIVLGQTSFTSGTSNTGGISANSLFNPFGISFDNSGNLWVADGFNNRVLEYAAGGIVVTPAKVTGGGSIGKDTNFGLDANSENKMTKGEVEYHDKNGKIDLHSTSLTSVFASSDLTQATIQGNAKVGDKSGFTFKVNVTDPDKTGNHDTFSIKVSNSTGNVVYQKSGTVQGHVEIHKLTDKEINNDK